MEHLGRKQQSMLAQLPSSGLSVWCIEYPDTNPPFHGGNRLQQMVGAAQGLTHPMGSWCHMGKHLSLGATWIYLPENFLSQVIKLHSAYLLGGAIE